MGPLRRGCPFLPDGHLREGPSPHDARALQVNPNSIAAKDGRIREGDRIIQVSRAGRPRRLSSANSSSLLLRARPDAGHPAGPETRARTHLPPARPRGGSHVPVGSAGVSARAPYQPVPPCPRRERASCSSPLQARVLLCGPGCLRLRHLPLVSILPELESLSWPRVLALELPARGPL